MVLQKFVQNWFHHDTANIIEKKLNSQHDLSLGFIDITISPSIDPINPHTTPFHMLKRNDKQNIMCNSMI